MHERSGCSRLPLLLLATAGSVLLGLSAPRFAHAAEPQKSDAGVQRETPIANPKLDRSGRKRVGTASVYHRMFNGRKMADGTRMDPLDDNAASKTLPLGTEAKVTNLKTGQSAMVTIQDRGPYVRGRIVDLSPATAEKIGITPKEGVTQVEVLPITVPPRESAGKN